jgi:hypothetical protein
MPGQAANCRTTGHDGRSCLICARTRGILILERFQPKVLRKSVDAPWYVPNAVIRRDIQTPAVEEEIRHYSSQYSARLSVHSN